MRVHIRMSRSRAEPLRCSASRPRAQRPRGRGGLGRHPSSAKPDPRCEPLATPFAYKLAQMHARRATPINHGASAAANVGRRSLRLQLRHRSAPTIKVLCDLQSLRPLERARRHDLQLGSGPINGFRLAGD
jgi:hypothetical protein